MGGLGAWVGLSLHALFASLWARGGRGARHYTGARLWLRALEVDADLCLLLAPFLEFLGAVFFFHDLALGLGRNGRNYQGLT